MDINEGKKRMVIRGKKREVIAAMREQAGLDETGAEKLLDFLERNPSVLDIDEKFEQNLYMEEAEGGSDAEGFCLGLMIPEYNYYINIKVSTAFLLSVLIDEKIPFPVTSLYLTARGMNRPIQKIEEDSGMKCILLELLKLPGKTGRADILDKFKGECCNNHLSCRFRNEGKCHCTCGDAEGILERLAEMGILRKTEDTYRYDVIGSL